MPREIFKKNIELVDKRDELISSIFDNLKAINDIVERTKTNCNLITKTKTNDYTNNNV